MASIVFLALLVATYLITVVSGTLHHMFVETFGTAVLYGLEFDDVALSLRVLRNNTATTSHSWIAFDKSIWSRRERSG